MDGSALSLFDQYAATSSDRVVMSAVIALTLACVVYLVQRSLDSARRRFGRGVANVGAGVVLLATTLLASAALLRLWAASPGVSTTLSEVEARGWLFGAQAVLSAVLLMAVYVVTRLVRRGMAEFAEGRQGVSDHQIQVAFRTGQVTLYAFALIVVLSIWGVNLGGLLVGAGFLGIVVGMAARQTLGALLAGFVLMFSRPFEIGDWVEIGDNEGVVTDITIVNTRIQTFDGEYVMIPNDLVASNEVVNRSRKGRLRIQVEVGVDYDTDLDRAMEVAKSSLRDVDEILSVPQPQVVAKSFGDSAVLLGLRVWIDKPSARRRWRAQTEVVRTVKAAFDEEDVKIPFPQREMSGRSGADGFRVGGTSVGDVND